LGVWFFDGGRGFSVFSLFAVFRVLYTVTYFLSFVNRYRNLFSLFLFSVSKPSKIAANCPPDRQTDLNARENYSDPENAV